MTMDVVCFKCGSEKIDPLKMCSHCQSAPQTREERISSLCLSRNCLKPSSLIKASKYIKLKNRLPGFREKVRVKALAQLDTVPADSDSYSQFIDLSDSFFEFEELEVGNGKTITVHAIGKPLHLSTESFAGNNLKSRGKTCHVLEWVVGKEISPEEADLHVDESGVIYVWYRWMVNKWVWKCVSEQEFEQLKELEK